jgi:hypothetical protein
MRLRNRKGNPASWPFWLLVLAWICANSPQTAIVLPVVWRLRKTESFVRRGVPFYPASSRLPVFTGCWNALFFSSGASIATADLSGARGDGALQGYCSECGRGAHLAAWVSSDLLCLSFFAPLLLNVVRAGCLG